MSRIIVELNRLWNDPLPQMAWIIGIGPIPGGGQGIGFAPTAGRKITGSSINMADELDRGPGNTPLKQTSGPNPRPLSAFSLCPDGDLILGIFLDPKLDAAFDTLPFSGAYANADSELRGMTRVSDSGAYMVIPASKFGSENLKEFNIHLVLTGKSIGGQTTTTRIILDPDIRLPPPGDGPG